MSLLADLFEVTRKATLLSTIEIPVAPVPASRPRVARNGGAFHAKPYANWLRLARQYVRKGHLGLASDTPLLVVVEQVIAPFKTVKRVFPKGDCDNLVKGPLDVVTKATGWWHDDEQITYLLTAKRFTREGEDPKTVMEIYLL